MSSPGGGSDEGAVPPAGPVRVVSGSLDGNVRIWDVRRGTCEVVLRHAHPVDDKPLGRNGRSGGLGGPITHVAVVGGGCSDGLARDNDGHSHRRLVAMTNPHKLFVWGESPEGWVVERELEMMERMSSPFLCLTGIAPQTGAAGSDAAVGCDSRGISTPVVMVSDASSSVPPASMTVDGYDVATGQRVCRATIETYFESCVALPRRGANRRPGVASRDFPSVLACGDGSGCVSLWDTSRAAFSPPICAHKDGVMALVALDLPRGAAGRGGPARWPVLVSASHDGTLAVWDSAVWEHARSTPRPAVKSVAACLPPAVRVAGEPPATDTMTPGDRCTAGSAFVVVTADERVAVRRWATPEETEVGVPLPPLGDVCPGGMCARWAAARRARRISCRSCPRRRRRGRPPDLPVSGDAPS